VGVGDGVGVEVGEGVGVGVGDGVAVGVGEGVGEGVAVTDGVGVGVGLTVGVGVGLSVGVGVGVGTGPAGSGISQAPRPCVQANIFAPSLVMVRPSTRTLGRPLPRMSQVPTAAGPEHV
jgi:hypothetical protein